MLVLVDGFLIAGRVGIEGVARVGTATTAVDFGDCF